MNYDYENRYEVAERIRSIDINDIGRRKLEDMLLSCVYGPDNIPRLPDFGSIAEVRQAIEERRITLLIELSNLINPEDQEPIDD